METVSENQLNGLRALQQDTNKYFSHLTQIISDTTKSPTKGVPKPIPFSGHPDNVWLEHFDAISSLNKWSQDDCANLLHIFLKGPALCYFQGLDVEVRHNFYAATSALKNHFDDEIIRRSLHLELHNLKQGQNESLTDFCFGLERKFIRLNIKVDFYKLLVFLDGVKPDIRFEVRNSAPQTYAEAKSLARNFDSASNEKLRKTVAPTVTAVGDASLVGSLEHQLSTPTVAAVGDASLVGSLEHQLSAPTVAAVGDASLVGSLEHQLSALQTQFNVLKRSLSRIESNNFRSRNFCTSFSRNTSSPTSGQATLRKRTSTRDLVCYKCWQKGHIAHRCRSRVGNLDSYNSFSHSTENRDSPFKFQPQPQQSVDSLSPVLLDTNAFSISVLLYGIPFNALVDTGSAISAISQDVWFKISNFAMADVAVLNPADFQTATGAPLKAHGTFQGIYQIDNNLYPQRTYITNHLSHPIILGRDFLSKYALSINFSTFQLTLSDNSNSEVNQPPTQDCFDVIDVSDKIPSFEEPRPKFSCPNLFNSSHTLQSDSDDLSETFMHNLEERCSDFQSVNSISKNLTDVTDSSEFRYSYFRLPSFKNVVLLCVFFAISLTVLFQITKYPQILFSHSIDS